MQMHTRDIQRAFPGLSVIELSFDPPRLLSTERSAIKYFATFAVFAEELGFGNVELELERVATQRSSYLQDTPGAVNRNAVSLALGRTPEKGLTVKMGNCEHSPPSTNQNRKTQDLVNFEDGAQLAHQSFATSENGQYHNKRPSPNYGPEESKHLSGYRPTLNTASLEQSMTNGRIQHCRADPTVEDASGRNAATPQTEENTRPDEQRNGLSESSKQWRTPCQATHTSSTSYRVKVYSVFFSR
eukprot:GHVT01006021.1.p1 GENE.GHVT01006021.1~~GHVT01006021.1.p1  ORF type:complete len:243 (-),score=27.71 GHVT01006021.1:320-1048(-)